MLADKAVSLYTEPSAGTRPARARYERLAFNLRAQVRWTFPKAVRYRHVFTFQDPIQAEPVTLLHGPHKRYKIDV